MFRWWVIPAIACGLLVIGAGVWAGVKLACIEPASGPSLAGLGEPCGGAGARACGRGLLCMPGVARCLLTGGASCKGRRAEECASGECDREREVCAIPLGVACVPEDPARPCPALATCDPATKTCVKRAAAAATDCSPNQGKACNCGGVIQCNGTCSAPACGGGAAPPRRADFNRYVLKAIDYLYQNYRGRGYDINSAFTHDIDYSQPGEIKAGPHPPATMCVAAVSEVIIAALKLYADESGDRSVFDKLPGRSWMKASALDIRPYMFVYTSVESSGTADALAHFGIGEHRPFPALVPGDFIGFNRGNGTGHAVVFLGFLNAKGELEPTYDAKKVVGFKYFSAQGKNPPAAGLGYRWAFFGTCPSWQDAGKPRDCGVIASDNQKLLNTGYMLHPSQWSAAPAQRMLKTSLVKKHSLEILSKRLRRVPTARDLSRLSPSESRQLEEEATRALTVELPSISKLHFDGSTTDD